ncbi:orotate phosphoribosyltransferase bacterial [Lucifera butyrica]|uniref:Orotate phosphoribosyltransferase n=1 Tax=Lucifera butyrica TaxID=1351585 RepID=A0A498R604_9FIRM|nr:orotate phosphoribosyltransferase [Lucifera butyrica]VBB06280.1 orotate phosphoribosyltransferase bacterial [Lucifera butyrica]
MKETDVKKLLLDTGAILEGHFLLTSGLHSPLYVEKFQVLQYPEHTARLCAALADRFRSEQVELVIGPVTGGIILAHEVGKNLGTRAIFTERENGKMALRRGFVINPGERVLIVEDIVTTGGSVQEVIDVVRTLGGNPVGVGMLVDRSGGKADFGIPAKSLLQLDVPTYRPEECPLCRTGVALTKRGSRKL